MTAKMKEKEQPAIVFFGTPRFAVYTLQSLEEAGIFPDIIITAPDKPAGRGLELKESEVKRWALEHDIPVLQPENLREESETMDCIRNSEWDLFIVSAYGKILPQDILALPRKGTLNVHPSLLPRFRGASPIESQILVDEKTVGVSIMLMDKEMDHGPIVAQASVTPEEWPLKASVLEAMLATIGGELLAETIPPWLAGDIAPEEQNHTLATFTKKIEKADGEVSLSGDPYKNYLKYCAYDGWPGVYFFIEKDGEKIRVKITEAEYKSGAFAPLKVIPEGKKEIAYALFNPEQNGVG